MALARPAGVNPHRAEQGVEAYIPLSHRPRPHPAGGSVQQVYIRRCHAKTSSNLAWAADKRYSLGVRNEDSLLLRGRH